MSYTINPTQLAQVIGNITVDGSGTPGNPSNGVISVQGVENGTPVPTEILDSNGDPLDYEIPAPVVEQKAVGQATSTKSTVTLTGFSQTLLVANPNRVRYKIMNRQANSTLWYSDAGDVVVSGQAEPILAGNGINDSGPEMPAGAITGIGTAGNVIDIWEYI